MRDKLMWILAALTLVSAASLAVEVHRADVAERDATLWESTAANYQRLLPVTKGATAVIEQMNSFMDDLKTVQDVYGCPQFDSLVKRHQMDMMVALAEARDGINAAKKTEGK